MAQGKGKRAVRGRRRFTEEFKREAVQMLLDGHSAVSVAQRLGLSGPNLLYRWKQAAVERAGPAARTLGDRSRAGYYAWLDDVETAHQQRDRELMPIVRRVFWHPP